MSSKSSSYWVYNFAAGVIFLVLLVFGIMKLLSLETGALIDWLIGIGTFAWLMTIVTVPWDIYFEAREVLNEASLSLQKQIEFDASQLPYVKQVRRWSLTGALVLHFVSAILLYWIAWADISVVGYFGAGAALLLTLLRPAIRAYEYISARLANIRQEITYPRDDLAKLLNSLEDLKLRMEDIEIRMDTEKEDSWLRRTEFRLEENTHLIRSTRQELENFQQNNAQDHERIMKETRHAVAQLSEDGKFIDNLVEIIRFIKKV